MAATAAAVCRGRGIRHEKVASCLLVGLLERCHDASAPRFAAAAARSESRLAWFLSLKQDALLKVGFNSSNATTFIPFCSR